MKPIKFLDANTLAKLDYETLKNFIGENYIFLTDDIVKEILAKKNTVTDNPEFIAKFNLLFNSAGGLNDNIHLILSHVPFGIENVVLNTKNKLSFKAKAKICSAHHLWLPAIHQPSLITRNNTHLNSEITWRLGRGEIDFSDPICQNVVNKVKLREATIAKTYYENSSVNVNRLFYTWIKRDKDIISKNYKISDSRLIAHALELMIAFKTDVTVITADYDVLDLKNNLFASILDKYVIYEALKHECALIDLKTDKHKLITVPMAKIHSIYEQTIKKIEKSKNVLYFSVDFYNKEKGMHDIFDNIIPDWLLEFVENYKGNVDCLALNEDCYKKYPIKYIWHADWGTYAKEYQLAIEREPAKKEDLFFPLSIKFEVWKHDLSRYADPMNETRCKLFCRYEMEEINKPEAIGDFQDINEIKDSVYP